MTEEQLEQEQFNMLDASVAQDLREQTGSSEETKIDTQNDIYLDNDRAVACGFRFMSAEDADMALQEENAIKYLKQHMKFQDPEHLKKVYQNAIQARTFQTPVGLRFLQQVREQILKLGVSEDDLIPVPVYQTFVRNRMESADTQPSKAEQDKKRRRIDLLTTSVMLNVALVILVVLMFVITLKSDNPNILNYRNAIINQYSEWQEDLDAKEAELRERELALKQMEADQ